MTKNNDTRIEQLLKFMESRPEDPFVPYAIGIEYTNGGDDMSALPFFEQVHREFPGYVPNYLHLGLLLTRLGREQDAAVVFQNGIIKAQQSGDTHAASELRGALESL